MSEQAVAAPPVSPQLQRKGAAAAEPLRTVLQNTLMELFAGFIDRLRAALAQAAQAVRIPATQGELQQLGLRLTASGDDWVQDFTRHVDEQLMGARAAVTKDSGRSQEGGEVALAAMELRAEARYQALITQLDARFDQVRQSLYIPIYARALAPSGLYRSLQDTADAQGWPPALRPFLFKQFDDGIVSRLELLYRRLLEVLDRIEADAKAAALAEAAKAQAAQNAEDDGPTVPVRRKKLEVAGIEIPKGVDAATVAMLKACAQNQDGEGYTDGQLAMDLLTLVDKRPLPGMTPEQTEVPLQRMTLAGKFLNDVMDDPLVPADMRPDQETMRLPLIKSALADPTLFTDVNHPLRSLVNEFMLKSAVSRISDSKESRRLADLLQEVLENFNLAPEFVLEAMKTSQPIQDKQIQKFFEQQREQTEQRRQFVIAEAKRRVAHELERATFGPDVPASAIKFLDQAWGPVATKQLLQYGAADSHWTGTLSLMERIMDALETRQPDEPPTPEWKELMGEVHSTMLEEGMSKAAMKEALSSLEAARTTV